MSYQDLYIIFHGSFISLGIFGKSLEVILYSEKNFETLSTSLRKFDTSNPWANGTHIFLPIVYLFIWTLSRSNWRSVPISERTLAPLVYHL